MGAEESEVFSPRLILKSRVLSPESSYLVFDLYLFWSFGIRSLFFNIYLFLFYVHVCFWLRVCLYTTCMPAACGGLCEGIKSPALSSFETFLNLCDLNIKGPLEHFMY